MPKPPVPAPVDSFAVVDSYPSKTTVGELDENTAIELVPETPIQIWVQFQGWHYQIELQNRSWIIQNRVDSRLSELHPPELVRVLKFASVNQLFLPTHFSVDELKEWADLFEQYSIPVFLTLPECCILPQQLSPIQWKVKRICDRMTAGTLLILASPILLGLAGCIRRDSSGTIFFKQWRVGEQGRLFRIYKFRTMLSDAEQLHQQVMGSQSGLHKLQHDPRVTSCGRWMRKYSLDELPQLLNVVRGEMSLVAPRPWALYDALRIESNGQQRLNALPGITGAWQIEARSTVLDLAKVNDRDLHYLRHWSLWRDLKILLLTIPKVLSGFGAY